MGKDKDIREAVETEFSHDPLLDAAGITVRTFNGSVALIGTVASYLHYREAAETARCVPGVTRVHNHLEVVLPPQDRRDDAMLTAAANRAIAASTAVPEGVEATAKNGDLALTGAVKYLSQRAAAETAVSGLTGVRNVRDEIQVVIDADPADVNRHVRDALDSHLVPRDHRHVQARVSGNTVALGGRVRTQAEHDAVVAAAWRAYGVMAVIDELEITG